MPAFPPPSAFTLDSLAMTLTTTFPRIPLSCPHPCIASTLAITTPANPSLAPPISFTPSTLTSTMPPTAPHTQPFTLALLPCPEYRHSLSCPATIACRRHTHPRQYSAARSGHPECMPRGQHTGVVSGYGAHHGEDQKLIVIHTYDWAILVQ